jgi:tetratricopeptide (TPR) repeat protein
MALRQETQDAHVRACLLLYRGLAGALLGTQDLALRDLTEAINARALLPDEQGQAYLQRGFLREELGQSDEALADYGAAIALKGYSTATAFNNRGNIYFRRGRLMDAQQDYLASLAADGGQSQQAYYGLGRVAESEGDRLAARDYYAKAVAIDGSYAAAAERLAALGGPVVAAVPAQRLVLRAPPAPQGDRGAALPAVPPLSPLAPMGALALRPAVDQSDRRIWPADEVQLGAWRSAEEARAAWVEIKSRASGLLDESNPQIRAADIPRKGRFFRLRVFSRPGESGERMCARLAARTLPCFVVRD